MPLNQKGFTLLDAVLGAALIGGILYGAASFWAAMATSMKQSQNRNTSTSLTEQARTFLSDPARCANNFRGQSLAASAPGPNSIQYYDDKDVVTGNLVTVGQEVQSIKLVAGTRIAADEYMGHVLMVFIDPLSGQHYNRTVALWMKAPGNVIQECKAGIDVDKYLTARSCVVSSGGLFKWDDTLEECVFAGEATRVYGDDFSAVCPTGLVGIKDYDRGCQPEYPASFVPPESPAPVRTYGNGAQTKSPAGFHACWLTSPNTCECMYRPPVLPPPGGTRVYVDCIPEGSQL